MSRNRLVTCRVAVLVAALLAAGLALADEARDWLHDMSAAAQSLNYRGTFVYLHNGQLGAMRIFHQATVDGERERLVALTGEAREVLRDSQYVTCILPKSKSVMVDRSVPRKPFPGRLPRDLGTLDDNYEFLALGEDRVAGLPSRTVEIRARDTYRYGYRLWLERGSKLLLRSDLIDTDGQPVEQMMFTDVEIVDHLDDADLEPILRGEDYTWVGHRNDGAAGASSEPSAGSDWSAGWLPPGFMLAQHSRHPMPSDVAEVEHLVFTDGLATVSVYVEPETSGREPLSGHSSVGAVNAYGSRSGDDRITVVGEVPRTTVERIGASMRRHP
ncbi:MAG: MucB/RseB C-terminal domain-containing protein [Thiohalobacteraceae bacterium]|nr:MucB/RseB C-terminal domain-containing protein [Gammaproteobacteria bacterium]